MEDIRLARVGFAEGQLNELCVAVHQTVAGQAFTIKLRGGDGDLATWEIDARNVELDGLEVKGNLTLDGVVSFGIAAEDTTTVRNADGSYADNPLEANPSQHRFGIDATFAEFSRITGTVYDMEIVGPFEMPGLGASVEPGTTSCPAPAAPTASPSLPPGVRTIICRRAPVSGWRDPPYSQRRFPRTRVTLLTDHGRLA